MGVGMLRETLDPFRREGGMGVPCCLTVTLDSTLVTAYLTSSPKNEGPI